MSPWLQREPEYWRPIISTSKWNHAFSQSATIERVPNPNQRQEALSLIHSRKMHSPKYCNLHLLLFTTVLCSFVFKQGNKNITKNTLWDSIRWIRYNFSIVHYSKIYLTLSQNFLTAFRDIKDTATHPLTLILWTFFLLLYQFAHCNGVSKVCMHHSASKFLSKKRITTLLL